MMLFIVQTIFLAILLGIIWWVYFVVPKYKRKKIALRVWHRKADSSHWYEDVQSLVEARLIINAVQWYTTDRGLEILRGDAWVEWRDHKGNDISAYSLEKLRADEEEKARVEALL